MSGSNICRWLVSTSCIQVRPSAKMAAFCLLFTGCTLGLLLATVLTQYAVVVPSLHVSVTDIMNSSPTKKKTRKRDAAVAELRHLLFGAFARTGEPS